MKRFVSLILSVCFLFSINTVSYAANISSRKASNPVIQSMNDKYHVDFSGMSIDELNKFIDKMKDEDTGNSEMHTDDIGGLADLLSDSRARGTVGCGIVHP